ncbi:MAG: ABC transporter permease [Verrucomicrobia bacterium]|jgi:ABC-type lipoprotein release transport system permease subunit|nr:ABC transporter permease [Verrucomicrobiota bacterium]
MLPFSYAFRNLLREPSRLAQKLVGSTLVVFLVLAAAAFNNGMSDLLKASGSPENVIFLGAGSEESVERSEIPVQSESMVKAGVRGIAERAGVAAVSGEVHYNGLLALPDGTTAQALTRGVTPAAFEVHRQARILEGDWPASGEVLVGALAHHVLGVEQEALAVGREVILEDQSFRVAGRFDAAGTVLESEIWFNRTDLRTLIQRDSLSCVVARLDDPSALARAELFAKQRLDLELVVVSEEEYYANLAGFYGPIRGMTWLTAVMVGIGAVMGGLNMLYAAFASRVRELATLQTLGFRRGAVLFSLIQESLLTQTVGFLIALTAATFLLDGLWIQFSMGTFRMELSPAVTLYGLLTAFLMGTAGTLPPAARCLGLPVPVALRAG